LFSIKALHTLTFGESRSYSVTFKAMFTSPYTAIVSVDYYTHMNVASKKI